MEEFLKRCEGKGSKKAASWGACAMLFTAKSDTAPLTKSLASQYEGKIAFGESRAANAQLSTQFNVSRCSSGVPALLFVDLLAAALRTY